MNVRRAFESALVQVVPPITRGLWWRDDFFTKQDSVFSVTAGGTNSAVVVPMGDNHPGCITQTVTAVADGARICGENASMAAIYFGGGEAYVEICGMVPTRSNGVDNMVIRAGLGDITALADFVDGIYLEYDFATHGDHNWRLCTSNNSVRTKTNTNVQLVAATAFRFRITVNATGTSVRVSFSGADSGIEVTTNIPVTAARASGFEIQTQKQLGAGALTVHWDYVEVRQDFTVER